jgi:hypothetical protein
MAALLEYVRPELLDEGVDRHHRSYVLRLFSDMLRVLYVAGRPAR